MNRKQKYIAMLLSIILIFKHLIPYLNEVAFLSGFVTVRKNALLGAFLFLMIELIDDMTEKFKNISDRYVAYNLNYSITGSSQDHEVMGEWVATRLGGFLVPVMGIVMSGKEGTAITHYSAIRERQGNVSVQGIAHKVELEELPVELHDLVEEKDLPEPVYLITAPTQVEVLNRKYATEKHLWFKSNKQRQIIEELNSKIEDMSRTAIDFSEKIVDNNKPSDLKNLKEKLTVEEDKGEG